MKQSSPHHPETRDEPKQFAALVGVTPGRVSQWLAAKQIYGAALVGLGVRARIRVSIARAQLKKNLDIDRHIGLNGRARLHGQRNFAPSSVTPVDALLEEKIKQARLEQLALSNAAKREEAALRTGRFMLTADATMEMGRICGRLLTTFESSFPVFADAIAAKQPTTPREAARLLQSVWRDIRARQSKPIGEQFDSEEKP